MLTTQLQQEIVEKLEAFNPEVFVVDLRMIRAKQNRLAIKVDTDKGISMSECASLSRQLGKWLEDHPDFDFGYNLEVSSPGIGSPLVLHRQYVNNVGRNLRIKLKSGEQVEANLLLVNTESIELGPLKRSKGKKKKKKAAQMAKKQEELAHQTILFADIEEAKVIITI